MKKKGSVTVFFSLFMAVLLILIQVIFHSVQIAGGRVQAETGVEEGLYSIFAGYHRELLKKYHVFLLDGGYGTGQLQPGYMYQILEESLAKSCFPGKLRTDIRGENLWKIYSKSGAIQGYTLATDQNGQAFKMQAVDYMKETVGIQGIQLLAEKMKVENTVIKNQKKEGESMQAESALEVYEKEKEQAQPEENTEETLPKEDFVNPLEVIGQLRKRGILALVLPEEAFVSQGQMNNPVSKRRCEQGMGTIYCRENPDTLWNNLAFQEYMMRHLTSYTDGRKDRNLSKEISYQLEYAVMGKSTDMENLKAVVTRLLGIREMSNLVFLLQNASRQIQIHEMALLICSYLGVPFLEGVVSLALQAAWAFGESVLDVRHLLQGNEVPLIKTEQSWNLSLQNLGQLPQILQETGKKQEGLNYEEYLRILIFAGNIQEQVMRTMDIVEQEIKNTEGNKNFRMDLCLSYMKAEMKVNCCGQDYLIQREYGYEM